MNSAMDRDIHLSNYYDVIIKKSIEDILESGLLLDEDCEVLVDVYDFETDVVIFPSRYKPSLKLISGILISLSTAFAAKKFRIPLLILPSAIITATLLYLDKRNSLKDKTRREIVSKVVACLIKVHKFNLTLTRYLKTRSGLDSTKKTEYFSSYNKDIEYFVNEVVQSNLTLFTFLLNILSYFSNLSDSLKDDYDGIRQAKLEKVLCDSNTENIEDCIKCVCKIQDIHTFISSKLLSFLGVVLISTKKTFLERTLGDILDRILPEILQKLNIHLNAVNSLFGNLKYILKKKTDIKQMKPKSDNNSRISTKLHKTLNQSLNNLSIIMEQTQNIMSKIEEVGEHVAIDELEMAVKDLRNHAHAVAESLDVLCKLYGIISSSQKASQPSLKKELTSDRTINLESTCDNVKHDDLFEPLEENFELFIKENDNDMFSDSEHKGYEEDNSSSAYLGLMLQELKQSLKQHHRYIEARKRRGSIENSEENVEHKAKNDKITPTKFNLEICNNPIKSSNNGDNKQNQRDTDLKPPPVIVSSQINMTPPPPPPPPVFSLNDLKEEVNQSNKSMFDNIKALSSQLNIEEDTFGNSSEDSEDDN